MYLPTVFLNAELGVDISPNQTPIFKLGAGQFEKVDSTGLGNYTILQSSGSSGFYFELDGNVSSRNFTLEYYGRPYSNSVNNVIWSSGGGATLPNQLALAVGTARVTLMRTYEDLGILDVLNEWEIPPERRGGDYRLTLTKEGTVYRVYFNGTLIITRNWGTLQPSNRMVLLAAVRGLAMTTIRYAYNGKLNYLKYHDRIVLPNTLWTELPVNVARDVALSMLPNTTLITPKQFDLTTLIDIQIVGTDLVAKFADGTMFLIPRQIGVDVGVRLTAATLNGRTLLLTLSNGQTIDLGENLGEDPGPDWPEGDNPYLIIENGVRKFVPILPQGDTVIQNTDNAFIVSLPQTLTTPISYANYLELNATVLRSEYSYYPNNNTANNWGEFITQIRGRGVDYTLSAEGRAIISPGRYVVRGSVLAYRNTNARARLYDVTNEVQLALTNPSNTVTVTTSIAAAVRPTEVVFNSVIDILSDVEIAIQLTGTASMTPNPTVGQSPFGFSTAHSVKLYKIA